MRRDIYSNKDLIELRERLNKEIKRRAGFKWFDPLATPTVGEDKSSPLSFPDTDAERVYVDDNTYTINNPSIGSIEQTKNIHYPTRGENPAGCDFEFSSNNPSSSSARFDVDELKNFIVGLSKIDDINLFYGRDEKEGTAFRDLSGISSLLESAESDKLNSKAIAICRFYIEDGNLMIDSYLDYIPDVSIEDGNLILRFNEEDPESELVSIKFDIDEEGNLVLTDDLWLMYAKNDPNGGLTKETVKNYPLQDFIIWYSQEDGYYVLPSGESDGEEVTSPNGLGPDNFFDDYGARPGDGNYHPYNRHVSPIKKRLWYDQDNDRNVSVTINIYGGKHSSEYGTNPRNPNLGTPYKSKPAYKGVPGSCNSQCTGLCFQTCDNICSESCTETCSYRCGNACTSSCGNVCTGCSSLCLSSCKSMCENISGYACINAGAKAVYIETTGGSNGIPARNTIASETHSCEGCSFSCQFYPNKKTECWDAGCMSKCFTSCNSACSTSCLGGCIDNESQNTGKYKTGVGRGCSGNCTINCIGNCQGVCEGTCTQTCWNACKDSCRDTCLWNCTTNCGSGCSSGCKQGCTGCHSTCEGSCKGSAEGEACAGCGTRGGCTSMCQHDCASNCLGQGCRAICGIESQGACESNCRIGCMNSSCTALCSDACSSACTSCVNGCDMNCGACSSECSAGCGQECNITCTVECAHSCETDCLRSCTEGCSSCTNLCYSCVGMCIGVCSVTCQAGCSSCTKTCGWWCDTSCNQKCFGNCDDMCLSTCSGNCSTSAYSDTTKTPGPSQPPTSEGYHTPNPSNRLEEQESFKIIEE